MLKDEAQPARVGACALILVHESVRAYSQIIRFSYAKSMIAYRSQIYKKRTLRSPGSSCARRHRHVSRNVSLRQRFRPGYCEHADGTQIKARAKLTTLTRTATLCPRYCERAREEANQKRAMPNQLCFNVRVRAFHALDCARGAPGLAQPVRGVLRPQCLEKKTNFQHFGERQTGSCHPNSKI